MKGPSVTTALGPFTDFSSIPATVLENACRRGGIVHAATAAYARGLWVKPLAPTYAGYFQSFKNWFDKYVDQVLLVEVRLTCDVYGFHGKPDLVCILTDGRFMVVDLKTPVTEAPTWKAQLAAYRYLVGEHFKENAKFFKYRGAWNTLGSPPQCMSLIVRADGGPAKAILYEYSDDDFAAYLSALNAYRYFK